MKKKLTIILDENVYDGLHRVVGGGKISHFIEALVKSHVDLNAQYIALAHFEKSDGEASEWLEGVTCDVGRFLE